MKHTYYYNLISKVLKFLIPQKKSILYYGYCNKEIAVRLHASHLVCVYGDRSPLDNHGYSDAIYVNSDFHSYIPERRFDYVVLDVALGMTEDIPLLLKNVLRACTPHTRIIIHQENYLWQSILKIAAKVKLKKKEKTKNWLSRSDIHTYLKAAGFESTRSFNKTLFPLKLGFIGPFINSVFSFIPILDFFKIDQFIIARPIITSKPDIKPSLTICITVRDEENNIEPIVSTLPILCEQQEILFVEGHSADNTINEIKRIQKLYPDKNIRLIHQSGFGQGDAIHTGFNQADGEIIILYEGDNTSDPNDIQHFYDCLTNRRYEFIEGSRFSYPMISESMPLINKAGNIFFAKWFSFFLRQRTTDVLSGIKAIRKKDFEAISYSWGFLGIADPFGDFELLYGSVKYGLKIGEIPIHYKPRNYGKSKTHAIKHGIHLTKMAWKGYFIFRNTRS